MLDECADGGEGWLANYRLDRYGDHADAHHFSDGGHGGFDGCHYSLVTVARVCGRNVVPRCRWWWCARVAAALAACGNGGARTWTSATVDADGVVGGPAVAVECAGGGWQPVAATAASAACGDSKCMWTATTVCRDGGGGVVRGRRSSAMVCRDNGGGGVCRWWASGGSDGMP